MDRTGIGLLLACLLCVSTCVLCQNTVNVAAKAPGRTCSQSSTHNAQVNSCGAANDDTGGTYQQGGTYVNCILTGTSIQINSGWVFDQTPWWQVNLGRVFPVQGITVWGREGLTDHMYPFTIHVGVQQCAYVASGDRRHSVACVSVLNGQAVRLTRDYRRFNYSLNLCELQVWVAVCPAGLSGDNCDQPCADANPRCASCTHSGSCAQCKAGYTGQTCSDCNPGYYKRLGYCVPCWIPNCDSRGCDSTAGCYGRCNKVSGTCDNGCVDGRHGARCDNQCTPSGCLRCGQNTGQCQACKADLNLAPPSCTECQAGSYRQYANAVGCTRCTWTCYNNTPCDKRTGHCSRCPPGYTGNTCQQTCSRKYGQDCSQDCGQCRGNYACNIVNGHCTNCQVGLQLPLCKEECSNGTYGEDCNYTCGHCQDNAACYKLNGQCALCEPGWQTPYCQTHCKNGTFGERCNKTCGQCEVNTTCHHVDGHCLANCATGFTGPSCLQEAKPATSKENKVDTPNNLVGPIVGAIVGAIVGVGILMTISVTAAICWHRKSHSSRSVGEDPAKASPISMNDLAPTASPEPSPSSSNEDNPYSEIRDPDDIYEITDMASNYDKLSPYSNDDGEREPYMQLP